MSHPRLRKPAAVAAATAMVVTTVMLSAPAGADPDRDDDEVTAFFTSFEEVDPQPDWENATETDADGNKRASGVTGDPAAGIPGNVTDQVVELRASAENPPNEIKERVIDRNLNTKWLVFDETAWVEVRLQEPVAIVHYALTSANDAPGRDPQDWALEGSHDGETWTTLDTQTGQDFPERLHTSEYRIDNDTAYSWYRLDVTKNGGDGLFQLAELQLSDGDTTPPPATDMKAFVSGGPVNGYTMKPEKGWTGAKALQYSGGHTAEGHGFAYNKVLDVNIAVDADTELSYVVFPELVGEDLSYASTYAAVDLAFTDGTYLSELDTADQHGFTLSPQGQGDSDSLWPDQWNQKSARIGDVAAGKTIDRILVGYDRESNAEDTTLFNGWIDDIWIGTSADASAEVSERLSDHVVTTRGTNSSSGFSRGNAIPATAVPHGFNFWAPMTDAGSISWLYRYQQGNNSDNLPAVEAFTASHEPSPWMGDRQTFQVMPSEQTPTTDRSARALPFRHENEVAKPHYYGVTFENGMQTEIAPTDHAAMYRFTFTGDTSHVMFDNVNNNGGLTLDAEGGVVTGFSDVKSGLSNGATRLFVYGEFDQPVAAADKPGDGARSEVFGSMTFDTSDDKEVTLRIATSLISIDQAKHNLGLEIAPDDSFEDVSDRAQALWDDKLGVIEVEGATEDQLTTLYSSLYRLFLYPNSGHENVGTNDEPEIKHAVQSSTSTPQSSPTETGAPIEDGKVYVNNGFWDTYRTVWSAYSLLASDTAGELVDGFVQQYRDGGWVSRWSSPGYANLMTGTSSDVSFADAYVKNVPGIDPIDTYLAALKNASVAPPGSNPDNPSVGRKGLQTSIFRGYTSTDVSEGVSWALEGYINDYGIANQAKALAEDPSVPEVDRERYLEEHEYFLDRARNYVNMFDESIDFFQGRDADGEWKSAPENYDPRVWGHDHDYTETDGWNFAFHVPHDGQGLANLYGGRDGLADKLDDFFATPETGKFPGSYGGIIHEIREARDIRLGQWGFSNQVSHHIPWMYNYTQQPWKTQQLTREVLSRMYVGSEIGQGYAGDEDNGETSAWYLFASLGFYPLQVGSENYAIGSPLFTKATVHLDNGKEIVINAPDNSTENVYVQGLTINGETWDRTYLSHDQIADGAVLDFEMGSQPSDWAAGTDAVLPSITDDDDVPCPLQDVTGDNRGTPGAGDGVDAKALFDNTSATSATMDGAAPSIEYRFRQDKKQLIRFYTLTSADPAHAPSSWVVKGSKDGKKWTVVDERDAESFDWAAQTRPFKLDRPSNFSRFRIEFAGAETVELAEVELLTSKELLEVPLEVSVDRATAWAGETATVEATVTNVGTRPLTGGEVVAGVPEGWDVDPASVTFGRLSSGESIAVELGVVVPNDAEPGAHSIDVTASAAKVGMVTGSGTVDVLGDVIEFSPFTSAEEPWLYENGGSQRSFEAHDGYGRYTDNNNYVIYRFPAKGDAAAGSLTMELANQFLVQVSDDGESWQTVVEETEDVRSQENRDDYAVDLSGLSPEAEYVYVRVGDSQPDNGWGAWIARVTYSMP